MPVNDDAQIDGYAPDVRMIETVTKSDMMHPMRMNGMLIIPWMSDAGCRFFAAHHRLFNLRYFARIGR